MNDLTFNRPNGEGTDPALYPASGKDGMGGREDLPMVLRYLRIAKRWRWLLLGTIASAVILGLLVTLLTTPLYTAEATIEIQREGNRIVTVEGVEPETGLADTEFYQTQYSLLRSRTLSERVATDLRLFSDAGFFEMFGENEIASRLRESGAAGLRGDARAENIRKAGEILLEQLSVSPIRQSRLVTVGFTSPDPRFSARVANAWTRHFIQSTLERKFEATSYARTFLEGRLEQLRGRLAESERLLVDYASRQRIINLPTSTPSANGAGGSVIERPLVAEDLSSLNNALNDATAARVAAQSRLGAAGGSTIEALQNPALARLRERRAELTADRARLLTQFDAQYPPVQALDSQIAEIDRSIAREEGRVRSTLQETFNAAVERETALRGRVEGLQSDLLDLRNRTIQYNIYQRDVDTNRQLYDGLLQRYKEIGVAGGIGVNNVAVVDAAEAPPRPSSPRLLRNVFLALLLGGVAAIGLAFALEQIDETISDPTDVEAALGLPLLGTVPKSSNTDVVEELKDPKSPLVDAYLATQARLAFTTDHGVPRTLTVTSTRPGEGKTTSSLALAQSLARTGKKVILVDADMRSPSLHHIFSVGNDIGLSNYLSGGAGLADVVRGDLPHGLSLLTAGPLPPNAAELLTGTRMDRLLADLQKGYDHVIVDAPPVMGLADTPLISSLVEGCVFVVESHQTRSSMARVAAGRLRDARVRVLGVLLTKFQARHAHYGYGYDYGYGYGENTASRA